MKRINILLLLLVCFACSVRASVYYAGGQSISYLSETYVTNDSYAAFGTYLAGDSQTVTNWTHTITNNSANARISVGIYVSAGESPFTNFISSETKVMAYPPSGSPVALTLTSVSNFWDSGDNNSFGIFSAPLGNVVATNWTVWVTNELQWSYFIGQSVISRNASQTLAPDEFKWGADDGTALTSLSLTNVVFTNDLTVAWAAHTATESYGAPIGNFWNLSSGDSPQNSLVTTNEAEKFLNYASTNNLTLPGWTFASDWPSGTANMVGTIFRIPYVGNGEADIVNGLAGGWKFNEGAGDSTADWSGNNLTAYLSNSPTWGSGFLTFDGVNDFAWVAYNAALYSTTYTISFWINSSIVDYGTNARPISMYNTADNKRSWSVFVAAASNDRWSMVTSPDGVNITAATSTSQAVETGWKYVVMTTANTGDTWLFYYQGNTTPETFTATGVYANQSAPLTLGGTASGSVIVGSLDDARVYNRVLTPFEINYLFTKGRK